MAKLTAADRAKLPDSAFAYIDSKGKRRLPINDESHVRNALSRFRQTRFESEAAREKARGRLLRAAKKHGIVPLGFFDAELAAAKGDTEPLPEGEVTFLLTDIEGSTPLLYALGDDYAGVLADVRAIIRQAVLGAGGRQVEARADEYVAVFEVPVEAAMAAVDLHQRMALHRWPDGQEVRVRAGIHTGDIDLTDSGYVGLTVHAAARIMAAAHGGQTLMSGDTARRCSSPIKPRSLGDFALRGLEGSYELFQVDAPGLPKDFLPPAV